MTLVIDPVFLFTFYARKPTTTSMTIGHAFLNTHLTLGTM